MFVQNEKKIRPLSVALAVVCALLAVAIATVAGPCVHDDGTVSMCHLTGQVLLYLGIAATLVAVIRIFVPSAAVSAGMGAIVTVLGVITVFAPGTFLPLCMMATMRCNAVMHPVAMVLGALICIVAIADSALVMRAAGK